MCVTRPLAVLMRAMRSEAKAATQRCDPLGSKASAWGWARALPIASGKGSPSLPISGLRSWMAAMVCCGETTESR